MLSFFKLNDPFRIIGILFLLLILRVPYLLLEIPLLQPELVWMLIGERMADGFAMYTDIMDDNGPLSAGVYWLIHVIFGKSLLAYKLMAGIIILFQIIYTNKILIQYKAFGENTYIPALVIVVLVHLSFDFLTLSPALMGATFILLALGELFYQTIRHQNNREHVLLVGLFGGIALCFHFPLIIFLPFILITGLAISGLKLPPLVLCLMGYFLPIALCAVYYFWIDGLDDLIQEFLFATKLSTIYEHVSYWSIAVLFLAPLLFTFLGFVIGSLFKRRTVNQQKQNQLMILYLIFSILTLFIANRKTPYQLIAILPGMTYFISQIFLYLNRKQLTQILFYVFVVLIPVAGYGWTYHKMKSGKMNAYAVPSGTQYDLTKNASVLVLGKDMGYYREASLSGPFLNYQLSKRVLMEPKSYAELTKIYLIFVNEKPEYIIDGEGAFAALLTRLPGLKTLYAKEKEGVYKLKQ